MTNRNLAGDIAAGAAAGAAATWLMGRTTTYLYENESQDARQKEDQARGGGTAYGTAAQKIASAFGVNLSPEQRSRYGTLIHWGLGIASGVAYAALRRQMKNAPAGNGVVFGLGLFLAMDEGMNWAFGLTPGPRAFPWQAHARGLAGHLVFGGTAEAAMRLVDVAA